MALFNALGLTPKAPYKKGDKPEIDEEAYKARPENAEKIKWSRPGHTIDKNVEASKKAKSTST
jgi:biotin synthase